MIAKLLNYPVVLFKACFADGAKALLQGKYTTHQALVIMAACIPAIAAAVMVTVPTMLFPTPSNQEFYYFASGLTEDPAITIPILLGVVCAVLGLRVPIRH